MNYPAYSFLAVGGTPPLSWTESGPMPPGLALDASGQVAGTPATAGTFPVSVAVSDSSMPPLTATAAVSLVINDSLITVAPASPPAGTVSYAYPGFTFSASGGSPPFTWAATGTVPPGLTLGTDGSLSGTPTQAGTFSFSVTPTDSAQTPVKGPALAVPIVIANPGLLMLNATPAPPAGVDGAVYGPFNFSVTGGFQPLHWSITAGSLPPGLTLGATDGSLSGTPTSLGTFPFTVTVTDSAATPAKSSQPFTVTITAPPAPTINYSEPPTATVGVAYGPFQFTSNGGLAPLVWSETGAQLPNLTLNTSGALSGTPNAAGQFPIELNVTDALSQPASPVPVVVRVSLPHSGSFTTLAEHLTVARSSHTATLLNSGKVLIAGGANGVADASAEVYDPATGAFTVTGSMTEVRIGHTATLLNDSSLANYGKVLIVGAVDTSAELYNPAAGTFTATGSLHHARTSPTATLLSNTGPNAGKVLIVGGNTTSGDLVAELYDPGTGTFTDAGSTTILRVGHTATLLTVGALAGQVLIAGGSNSATAELYSPATGMFTRTGSMTTVALSEHTATRLGTQDGTQNGFVLVTGIDGSADLYDPGTQTFTAVGSLFSNYPPDTSARTAALRNDGTVLVSGGYFQEAKYFPKVTIPFFFHCVLIGHFPESTSVAAVFAPESDGFTETAFLNTSRDGHTATVLTDGAVLIVGGIHHAVVPLQSCSATKPTETATVLSSAELFK